MKCKNCGANVNDNAKVCPNCGAFCGEETGYVFLAANDDANDYYEYSAKSKRKKSNLAFIIIAILIIALITTGSYFYFTRIYDKNQAPSVLFTEGSGIINSDEKVIYVAIGDNSNIEYIHGVSLYPYDKSDSTATEQEAISADYQYTKSNNDSFRAIFFDTDDLELDPNTDYTYTFEMQLSFKGSDKIFTYDEAITFNSNITEDASDIIFDHSTNSTVTTTAVLGKESSETTKAQTTTTQADSTNVNFIYNSYWFTEPYHDADSYTIFAIKFNSDGTYVSTQYYKNGDESWQVTTYQNTYELDGNTITMNNGDGTESTTYTIDSTNQTITDADDSSSLTSRRYNSVKNAEDFFGI